MKKRKPPTNGRKFVKGQPSANPSGRPKGFAGVARMIMDATGDGAEIVRFALAALRSKKSSERHREWAAEWLADRGLGKALQVVSVGVRTPAQQALVDALVLTPHRRERRIAELKAQATAAEAEDLHATPRASEPDADG